jgi:hypothetical protein
MYKLVYQNRVVEMANRKPIDFTTLKKDGLWSQQSLTSPLREEQEHGSAGMGGI